MAKKSGAAAKVSSYQAVLKKSKASDIVKELAKTRVKSSLKAKSKKVSMRDI